MMNLSSFDLIWHYIFAYGYVQVAVHQRQELGYHLHITNGETDTYFLNYQCQQIFTTKQKKQNKNSHFPPYIKILPEPHSIP